MNFAAARRMMVDGQLRTQDVTDPRILDAAAELPRERFLPGETKSLAYLDRDLPLQRGKDRPPRFLLKPAVLAKLIQAAEIEADHRVLVVGCATGYSAALLAHLAGSVIALDEDETFAAIAERNLHEFGRGKALVRRGPLTRGAPEDAPFEVILIEGAIEELPDALAAQLNQDGRLVCVRREGPVGKGTVYRRGAGAIVNGVPLFDAFAPVLPGFQKRPVFAF